MAQFTLPNLFACIPFSASVNPHHEPAAAESFAWVDSYNFFVDRKRAHFLASQIDLLAAYCYPSASYDDFRTICDYTNVLFVIDEISDEQDGRGALETAEICMKAFGGEKCDMSDTKLYKLVSEYVNT
jgi:hypothetical protein